MILTTVDYYFSPPRPVQKIKITPNNAEVPQIIFRLIGLTSSYETEKLKHVPKLDIDLNQS